MVDANAEPELALSYYQLGARAGAGAAGSVFRATDVRTSQDVVVKFFDGEEDGFALWASEMRLALRLRHAHIVACLDVGYDERHGLWVMVFARAKGGSLRRVLAARQRFSTLRTTQLLTDIAAALAYAHRQGVVHRDVKPENILAAEEDAGSSWLLTDFGAGRFLPRGEVAHSIAGSVEYMAPEVHAGGATAASDQFSLGVVGLELCLGHRPSVEERPAWSARLRPKPGLLGIIGRLLASEPAQRFSEMTEVEQRLQQELTEMKNGSDVIDSLRRYLEERHGMSGDLQLRLMDEWGQKGSLIEFLVQRNLLPRSMARTLDAVRNGYVDMSLETVLGISRSAAPFIVDEAPAPHEPPLPLEVDATVSLTRSSSAPAAPPNAAPPNVAPPNVAPPNVAPPSAPIEITPSSAAALKQRSPRPVEAAKAAKPSRAMPGMRMGRYVLQEPLGEGATATVFRAFHEMLSMPIAIKVFEPIDSSSDPDAAQRFRREAQTLIRIEHPHIVRVLDVDIFDEFPFIVMEYVGETTLSSQIRNLGRLPANRIAQIGIAVSDALDAAWKVGLLHRDVKPSNIIERKDGHIKLVDFGISAKKTAEGGLNDPQASLGLVSGTPSYLAPEQAQQPNGIDFRADMYGLGATLYHAAVGRPPFLRATARDTILAQINEEATSITQLEPGFDLHLAWTIHRMLRKRPDDRFGSWAEVKESLAHTLFFQEQPEIMITASGGHSLDGSDTATSDLPDSSALADSPESAPAERPRLELEALPTQPQSVFVPPRSSQKSVLADLYPRFLALPAALRAFAALGLFIGVLLLLLLVVRGGGS